MAGHRNKGYILTLTLVQAVSGGQGVLYALLLRNIADSAADRDSGAFWHNVVLIVALVVLQISLSAMQGMYLLGVVYSAYGILYATVSYGTMIAIMQLSGQIQGAFVNISGYLPRYYAMTASAERIVEIEAFANDVVALYKYMILLPILPFYRTFRAMKMGSFHSEAQTIKNAKV